MKNAKTAKKISGLFMRGYAPSQIDRMLGFAEGTARGVMVDVWAADKEAVCEAVNVEKVLNLLVKGFAPSRIDKMLKLASGTAHDAIVESWAADSRRDKHVRYSAKALDLFEERRCG